jgi:hypothetical protein
MNDKEIKMLRHTVGADSKKPGYRNRYCTEIGDETALSLVSKGLFSGPLYYNGEFGQGYGLFFATDKAFKLLGIKTGLE